MKKRSFDFATDYRGLEEAIKDIFNEEFVLNTKLYAAQHYNHDFQITIDDPKIFIGILLLTGYHSLPQYEAAAGSTDKIFKVLADVLIKKFFQWSVVHEHLTIDESMVKYFGRHPAKQFIRDKPVLFGYKTE
ncbi:jg18432 [Pararge aegeria aegeria]|uniref:Jg18432 protein n=1 Tax=Pararge aegeria aegeria TaxID=348720 RepID=A0A8S4SGV9_9NEOP|nr:jg18432 [Pararge aegeria aegeria]